MPASWCTLSNRRAGRHSFANSCSISPPTSTICDLRGGAAAFIRALDPDNYDEGQALAVSLRAGGSGGLVHPSQRDPSGQCVGLFYPDRAGNLIQGRHLDYHWDGGRVDLYRDAGSGEIYRVS